MLLELSTLIPTATISPPNLINPVTQRKVQPDQTSDVSHREMVRPSVKNDAAAAALNGFFEELDADCFHDASTIRTTFFFDGIGGGGFLSFPHLGNHGSANTAKIMRVLEHWLCEKLTEPSTPDTIPILEAGIENSAQQILAKLRSECKVFSGVAKCHVHVRNGHVFMLHACQIFDDETISRLGSDDFFQRYPLFVDVSIRMQAQPSGRPAHTPTILCLAFENIVGKTEAIANSTPYVLVETIDCDYSVNSANSFNSSNSSNGASMELTR
jgi:hypothetical protein